MSASTGRPFSGPVGVLHLAEGLLDIGHVAVAAIRKARDEIHFPDCWRSRAPGFSGPRQRLGTPCPKRGSRNVPPKATWPALPLRHRVGSAGRSVFFLVRADPTEGPRHVGGVQVLTVRQFLQNIRDFVLAVVRAHAGPACRGAPGRRYRTRPVPDRPPTARAPDVTSAYGDGIPRACRTLRRTFHNDIGPSAHLPDRFASHPPSSRIRDPAGFRSGLSPRRARRCPGPAERARRGRTEARRPSARMPRRPRNPCLPPLGRRAGRPCRGRPRTPPARLRLSLRRKRRFLSGSSGQSPRSSSKVAKGSASPPDPMSSGSASSSAPIRTSCAFS